MSNITRREALSTLAATTALPAASAWAAPAAGYRLCTFSAEITCPIGHPLMGGGIAPAKEIIDPLYAHGFIILGAGKPIVSVALDWCEVRNGAYEAWREGIAKAVGTDPVRVMCSSLHQHDTPIADLEAEEWLTKFGNGASICQPEFHARCVSRVAAAAKASLEKSQPITHIGIGTAKVEKVGSNRRYRDEAGKIQYNRMSATRDPKIQAADEGDIDPLLRTVSFWNGDRPLLAASAYSTHPMSFYGKGGVTTDFVGMARDRRQAAMPDTLQIYFSGCSGNVTAGKYNDGSPANRPVLADRLAKAMTAAWDATKKIPLQTVEFRSVPIALEARSSKGFSKDELLARLKSDPSSFGRCLAALGLSWQQRVAAGRPIDLPVLELGLVTYLVLPAESYVEYQLYAQAQRPNRFILTAGYGECGPGYIPIERAWKEDDSNLRDWSWVNPGSQPIMEAAIRAALTRG